MSNDKNCPSDLWDPLLVKHLLHLDNFEDERSHFDPKNLSKPMKWSKYNSFSSGKYYFQDTIKDPPLGLRQFLAAGIPLKMMKNVFISS